MFNLLWGGTGEARALQASGHPGSTSARNFCLNQGEGGRVTGPDSPAQFSLSTLSDLRVGCCILWDPS